MAPRAPLLCTSHLHIAVDPARAEICGTVRGESGVNAEFGVDSRAVQPGLEARSRAVGGEILAQLRVTECAAIVSVLDNVRGEVGVERAYAAATWS
jgi:hypothetical protein